MVTWLGSGYGWCATTSMAGTASENAVGSNVVVIDFDGDTSLRFWSTDTARQWCAATYTSASHTEQEHRFGPPIPLARQLNSSAEHRVRTG